MNKPKLSGKKWLSVKIYRNLRRNFCYGIYFNKLHAICKGKFQKCDHIYLAIHPHTTVVGRDYRLSNSWLAKEVNKELKKELLHQCL
jgi:hypothetical protein